MLDAIWRTRRRKHPPRRARTLFRALTPRKRLGGGRRPDTALSKELRRTSSSTSSLPSYDSRHETRYGQRHVFRDRGLALQPRSSTHALRPRNPGTLSTTDTDSVLRQGIPDDPVVSFSRRPQILIVRSQRRPSLSSAFRSIGPLSAVPRHLPDPPLTETQTYLYWFYGRSVVSACVRGKTSYSRNSPCPPAIVMYV